MGVSLEFHFQTLKMAFKGNYIVDSSYCQWGTMSSSSPRTSISMSSPSSANTLALKFHAPSGGTLSKLLLQSPLGGALIFKTCACICTTDFYPKKRITEVTKCQHHFTIFRSLTFPFAVGARCHFTRNNWLKMHTTFLKEGAGLRCYLSECLCTKLYSLL